ncbi:HTH_Tnp_Tc3_2 domain-containing protein [Trichonephila clavata]|uniref:HTH_Tnp_Tc3_2 domain-containing protein n=1 Tax=Trichonephila clavata TaxID=2740835 RepID=A0A8X6KSU4_TRICU|nr:HTH_Tnp_Tc3_2 domain-containing protein [Trichonephila clavata]
MENRKETTIEERKLVIKLSKEGKSLRNIVKVFGRSVNCIQKILQKFKKTGMLANTKGRGRKKIMNSITERRVIQQVKIDPKISAPEIAASISNTLGRSVSAETVRRVLRKAGYNGGVARKMPLIEVMINSDCPVKQMCQELRSDNRVAGLRCIKLRIQVLTLERQSTLLPE